MTGSISIIIGQQLPCALPYNFRVMNARVMTYGTYSLEIGFVDSRNDLFANVNNEVLSIDAINTAEYDLEQTGHRYGASEA